MSGNETLRQPSHQTALKRIPGLAGLTADLGRGRVLTAQVVVVCVCSALIIATGFLALKDVAKLLLTAGVLIWALLSGNAKRNLIVAYLLCITLPFAFFSELFIGKHYVDFATSDLVAVLIFLPWLVGLTLFARHRSIPISFAVPIILLITASVISIPLSYEPRLSVLMLAQMAGGGIAFAFIARTVSKRSDYDLVTLCMIGIAVYMSIYGIMQFSTGSPQLFSGESVSRTGFGGIWSGRVRATLSGPNSLSGFLVAAIPLAVSRLIRGGFTKKLAALVAIGLMVVALALTFSRNGYLCLAFALLLMGLLLVGKYRNFKVIASFGFLGLLVLGGLAVKFQPAVILRLISIRYYMYDPASILRLMFWKGMIHSFLAHPLTGVGLGNFVHQPFSYGFIAAHNVFFNTMGETGIFGIVGLLALVGVIFRALLRVYRKAETTYAISESVGLLGCWSAIVLHGVFDTIWSAGSHTREIKLIWVFLAITLIFIRSGGFRVTGSRHGVSEVE